MQSTVLILDDDELLANLVRRLLEREGYHVLLAHDGTEALAAADRHRGSISLLLTDVVMDGISGYDVAKQLQSSRPETKVIFMTGDGALEDGLRVGHILPKPFSLQSLLNSVRSVIDTPGA